MNWIKELIIYYEPKNFGEDKAKVYMKALSNYPEELLSKAVDEHIRTSPYFPKVSELIKAIQAVERKERHDETTVRTDVLERDYRWWIAEGGQHLGWQHYTSDQFWGLASVKLQSIDDPDKYMTWFGGVVQ